MSQMITANQIQPITRELNPTPKTADEWIQKYKTLEGERLHYLYAGHYLDRVTFGDTLILGTNQSPNSGYTPQDGTKFRNIVDKPFHDVGGRCLRHLSARQFQYLFPNNSQYFQLSVPPLVARALDINPQAPETVKSLNLISDDVLSYLDQHQVLSKLKPQLERVNLEGQGMIHVSKEGTRTIPLRSFVVKRDGGKPRYAIICEEMEDNKNRYYTVVNYETDKVYQINEEAKELKTLPESCVQYVIVCTKLNEFTNYSYAFAWQHLSMLNVVNSLMRAVDKGAFLASVMALINDPESGQSNEQVKQIIEETIYAGKVEGGKPKHLGIFTAEAKMADMQIMIEVISMIVQRLEESFAMKLYEPGPSGGPMTATEAAIRNQALEQEINSHCSTLVQTLVVPLIKAVLWVLGHGQLSIKQDPETGAWVAVKAKNSKQSDPLISVEPIAGISQLTRQIQMQQLGEKILLAFKTNPTEAGARISVVNYVQVDAMINNLPFMEYIIPPQQPDQSQSPQQMPMNQQQG